MTHASTEALQAIQALREWIQAIPDEVAASLPAMPGVDGDWLDLVEQKLKAPQAQRAPLSDSLINGLADAHMGLDSSYASLQKFARAIERAHGIGG